jgi:hypothetical protein
MDMHRPNGHASQREPPSRPIGRMDMQCVRREPCKVLIFSGCNSHPATGSLQPVAIEATRGGNETVGAFETDGSL